MSGNSKHGTSISWTHGPNGERGETWNPITGCSKVSPGCASCYAEALSLRMGWSAKPWTPENAAENVILHHDRLLKPLSWKAPRMIFVNSMSDLFHELVPFEFVDKVFAVMALCRQHTFQVLTKRPERMLEYMSAYNRESKVLDASVENGLGAYRSFEARWPLPNVWMGVSAENQHWWDIRVLILARVPAVVRFVSAEPLLGPIDCRLREMLCETAAIAGMPPHVVWEAQGGWGKACEGPIHQIIVGGESGPGFRPMQLEWARDIQAQCEEAGVAFFFKQISAFKSGQGEDALGRVYHQFPEVAK